MDFVIKDNILKKYAGPGGNVVIPDGVTSIGDGAFSWCKSLTSITIPDSVISIGDQAFQQCRSLTSVTIPDGVTSIGKYAFFNCSSLTSITIPVSVTNIGDEAFFGCMSLTSITIPVSVTSIGIRAFSGCDSVTNITIPDSVTSIGDEAFSRCKSLTSITIPDSVISIGDQAFQQCSSLTSITIPDSVTSIGNKAFSSCNSLTSITIPDGVISIGKYAFSFCSSLTSITIPDSVTSIGNSAFSCCDSVTNITIPDSVTSIGESAFSYCPSLTSINVQEENAVYASCDGVLFNKDKTTFIQYPSGKRANSYVVPDGVTSIGNHAFRGCKSLKCITIPDSVISIGESAFSNCSSLTSIEVQEDNAVYASCDGVLFNKDKTTLIWYPSGKREKSYVIPDSVTSIVDHAFSYCGHLTNVIVSNGITTIENRMFNSSQLCITVPGSLQRIAEHILPDDITIAFKDKIPDLKKSAYGKNAKFQVRPHNLKTDEKLPGFLANYVSECDAEAAAYVLLYQSGKDWTSWLLTVNVDHQEVLAAAVEILSKQEKAATAVIKRFTEYITSHLAEIDASGLQAAITVLETLAPKAAKGLKDNPSVQSKLSDNGEAGNSEHEIEAYVRKQQIQLNNEAASVVDKGVPYADGSGVSSRVAAVAVVSIYAEMYQQHCESVYGSMGGKIQVLDHSGIAPSKVADEIAAALDTEALCKMISYSLHGTKYRLLLLTYTRYASEQRIRNFIADINTYSKGKAKDRYWAQNAEEALYLSDQYAAAEYLEKKNKLYDYATMRGYTEADYRDTYMLLDFGMDKDGKRTFDVNGDTIEVSVTPELKIGIFDTQKNKAIRSFPKQADKTTTAQFTELQKSLKDFIKMRTRMLKQFYLSGEAVSGDTFATAYLTHPVLRQFARLLVWTDTQGNCFTVNQNYQTVDIHGAAYTPDGDIQPAHVMDMQADEVTAWQQYLDQTKQKQLFAQMWEPIVVGDSIPTNLTHRYDGAVVTQSERNEFKRRMAERGIDVRADAQEAEFFDPRAYKYVYSNDNTLNIGHIRMPYTVNPEEKTTTFHVFSGIASCPKRELNVILFEMDRMCLRHACIVDDVAAIHTDRLDGFTVMQISDLLQCAIKNHSVNCTAMLLEYKNNHFGTYEMDEFTLD